MLRRSGKPDGDEGEAAERLEQRIRMAWPWVDDDPDTDLVIIAGMKCYGERREDLDVVLLGRVGPKGTFAPTLDFYDKFDQVQRPHSVRVESLSLVIEVKSHDQHGIKYESGHLFVQYPEGPEDTTEKNFEQIHSFRNYLTKRRLNSPFTVGLIWLLSVPAPLLPPQPHNLLGSTFNWDHLLSVVARKSAPKFFDGRWNLTAQSLQNQVAFPALLRTLTATVQVSALDRARMDRIAKASVPEEWLNLLGNKMLILRGRGGTGKTVSLLQLAWQGHNQTGGRVLILTFNRALAADLRRLWTLLGYPDEGMTGLRVRTTMSYFYIVLRALGVLPAEADDFTSQYAEYKRLALEMLAGGALGPDDITRLRTQDPAAFEWDYVFIDEAQDWPEDERDLLIHLFPDRPFAIADGRDQLVRQGRPCDWAAKVQKPKVCLQARNQGLRMKANLTRFANTLARHMGLGDWSVEVNAEAEGGQVIVVSGDYLRHTLIHAELLERNRTAGNAVIDLLACVPPARVHPDLETGRPVSDPGRRWREQGRLVWDGVDPDLRDSFPSDLNEFRIVQYDSCRGLEGWMAFLFGLDQFYEYKRAEWRPDPDAEGALANDPTAAARYAARWLMIPLTRAMDTLVIELAEPDGPLQAVIRQAAADHRDFVRWVEGEQASPKLEGS